MALFITFSSPKSVLASKRFLTFSVSYGSAASRLRSASSSHRAASACSTAVSGSSCAVTTKSPGSTEPLT